MVSGYRVAEEPLYSWRGGSEWNRQVQPFKIAWLGSKFK